MLNPVIRGWANYHRHIVAATDVRTSGLCDMASAMAMGQTQTSGKDRALGRQAVLASARRTRWAFAADTGERTPEGKPIWLKLVLPAETKIRRHIKIRADANPFDPRWQRILRGTCVLQEVRHPSPEAGIKPS